METSIMSYSDLYKQLIDQAPDAIIFADKEGLIRVWNGAAERIFGFLPAEAMGASLDIIIPESFRAAHWQGFQRAIKEKTEKYAGKVLPTKAIRADGSQIYVELSFSLFFNANKMVIGAVAHAREITERFNKEKMLKKRLQELEKGLTASICKEASQMP